MNATQTVTVTQESRSCFSFETGSLHADGDGPLTQGQVNAIWSNLPMTGCSSIERGLLYVQQRDGAVRYCCGPVAAGVTRVTVR